MSESIVIVGAKRTPIGGMNGQFVSLSSPQLAAVAIKSAVEQSGLQPKDINEAILGCVLPAAVGQAPARQAILGAGLLKTTACATLNKVCGSGMKSAMLAYDQILAGSADVTSNMDQQCRLADEDHQYQCKTTGPRNQVHKRLG